VLPEGGSKLARQVSCLLYCTYYATRLWKGREDKLPGASARQPKKRGVPSLRKI